MKFESTAKAIKENYWVMSIGYCGAQYLLRTRNPIAYTHGVYGWNSDVYECTTSDGKNRFAISTGYRPFSNFDFAGKHELVKRYEDRAREIAENYEIDWRERDRMLEGLVADFIGDVSAELQKIVLAI